jgi:hypothetical protein
MLCSDLASSGISKFRKIASYNGSPLHTQAIPWSCATARIAAARAWPERA